MKFGDIEVLAKYLKVHRDKFVTKFDQDYTIIVCGHERTSKSTLAMYLGNYIDPEFGINNICFDVNEYIRFQLNSEFFKDLPMPAWYKGDIKKGSAAVFDEGGTQAYSREFYSPENIELNKIFIGGGALNLIHFICVPKPKSIDVYLREERAEMFIYNFFNIVGHYKSLDRYSVVYTRDSIDKILDTPKWWTFFRNNVRLRAKFPPDGFFKLPNLREIIPEKLMEEYIAKKTKFVRDLFINSLNRIEEKRFLAEVVQELAASDLNAREQVVEWKKRTGLGQTTFFKMKAKEAPKQNRFNIIGPV